VIQVAEHLFCSYDIKFDAFNFPLNCSVIIITVQIITLQMKGMAKQVEESFSV